jgi:hypothetical protein
LSRNIVNDIHLEKKVNGLRLENIVNGIHLEKKENGLWLEI